MKFGKLLAAGKNIFGGAKTVVYRQDKHVYLPKFNVEKNPFLPKVANPAAIPTAESAPTPMTVVASAPVAAKSAAVKPLAIRPAFAAGPKMPEAPATQTGWAGKLNPFRAATPAPAPQPLTQPELLSLDSVKVLHNDLSDVDVDVDVVPVKSRTVSMSSAGFLGEQLLRTA